MFFVLVKEVVEDGNEPDSMNESIDFVGPFALDQADRFARRHEFRDQRRFPRVEIVQATSPDEMLRDLWPDTDIMWIDEDPDNPVVGYIEPTVDPIRKPELLSDESERREIQRINAEAARWAREQQRKELG